MSATARLYTVQELSIGKLSIMPRPRGGDWLLDDIKALSLYGVDILVSLLTPGEVAELNLGEEADICQHQGITCISYPIIDRSVPPFSVETFALLERIKTYLAEGKHIAVHCWMGLGRSALVAASVLVLSGYSPEDACNLLSSARGYTVPETQEQRAWVEALPQQYTNFRRRVE